MLCLGYTAGLDAAIYAALWRSTALRMIDRSAWTAAIDGASPGAVSMAVGFSGHCLCACVGEYTRPARHDPGPFFG